MESMDNVRERFETLEQQAEPWQQHIRMVDRRPRWGRLLWCVAALGLALIAVPRLVQAKIFHCGGGDVPCLIAAINEANANGEKNTIRLAAGTYSLTAVDNTTEPATPGGPPEPNGLPSVTSILTLRGAGAAHTVIERAASAPGFRLLHVTGSLTLQGLTLRGGSAFQGGGLFNSGTVTLRHCALIENGAHSSGGGIYNRGTLTLRDSILRDNVASEAVGGGLVNDGGLVTIAHTTFETNRADNSAGGLLNGGTMTIAHTTFVSNLSFGAAGGLDNSGSLTITDSAFVSNVALPGRGGGLFNSGTLTITDSTFVSNTGLNGGGGLFNGGTLTITNTTFNDNGAELFGLFGGGGGVANSGTLTLINSTIADNRVFINTAFEPDSPSGGGLANGGSGTVRVANIILAGNTRSPSGAPNPIPDECRGLVTSLGHNLIGDPTGCTITLQASDLTGDPGLGPFTDNGQPGNGHFPLLATSQAIDAGNDAVCPRRDQLGQRRVNIPRVGTSRCDIGAIEFPGKDDRQHDDEDDQHDEEDDHHDKDLAATAQTAQ